jgi:hypothetical protein
MFKKSKQSKAQQVGSFVGAAASKAFLKPKPKKSHTKRNVMIGGAATVLAAVVGGALTKPSPDDRQ